MGRHSRSLSSWDRSLFWDNRSPYRNTWDNIRSDQPRYQSHRSDWDIPYDRRSSLHDEPQLRAIRDSRPVCDSRPHRLSQSPNDVPRQHQRPFRRNFRSPASYSAAPGLPTRRYADDRYPEQHDLGFRDRVVIAPDRYEQRCHFSGERDSVERWEYRNRDQECRLRYEFDNSSRYREAEYSPRSCNGYSHHSTPVPVHDSRSFGRRAPDLLSRSRNSLNLPCRSSSRAPDRFGAPGRAEMMSNEVISGEIIMDGPSGRAVERISERTIGYRNDNNTNSRFADVQSGNGGREYRHDDDTKSSISTGTPNRLKKSHWDNPSIVGRFVEGNRSTGRVSFDAQSVDAHLSDPHTVFPSDPFEGNSPSTFEGRQLKQSPTERESDMPPSSPIEREPDTSDRHPSTSQDLKTPDQTIYEDSSSEQLKSTSSEQSYLADSSSWDIPIPRVVKSSSSTTSTTASTTPIVVSPTLPAQQARKSSDQTMSEIISDSTSETSHSSSAAVVEAEKGVLSSGTKWYSIVQLECNDPLIERQSEPQHLIQHHQEDRKDESSVPDEVLLCATPQDPTVTKFDDQTILIIKSRQQRHEFREQRHSSRSRSSDKCMEDGRSKHQNSLDIICCSRFGVHVDSVIQNNTEMQCKFLHRSILTS